VEKLQRYAGAMFSAHPTLEWFVAGGLRVNWAFRRRSEPGLPHIYGPIPPYKAISSNCWSFINPDTPFDFLADYLRPVNPDRFWDDSDARCTLDYPEFLVENQSPQYIFQIPDAMPEVLGMLSIIVCIAQSSQLGRFSSQLARAGNFKLQAEGRRIRRPR
jgi:hypothetical protein